MIVSKNDVGFTHNGALAGLVAVCAGSDLYHPIGALVVGIVAGFIFAFAFQWETTVLKVDDVLGVWPLHGLCGTWGGLAVGFFGRPLFGGLGGVSLIAQLVATLFQIVLALGAGVLVSGLLKKFAGLRLSEQQEVLGADISLHHIEAYPEEAL